MTYTTIARAAIGGTPPGPLDVEKLLLAFHETFCSKHGHPVEYDRPIIEKVAAEYARLTATPPGEDR